MNKKSVTIGGIRPGHGTAEVFKNVVCVEE